MEPGAELRWGEAAGGHFKGLIFKQCTSFISWQSQLGESKPPGGIHPCSPTACTSVPKCSELCRAPGTAALSSLVLRLRLEAVSPRGCSCLFPSPGWLVETCCVASKLNHPGQELHHPLSNRGVLEEPQALLGTFFTVFHKPRAESCFLGSCCVCRVPPSIGAADVWQVVSLRTDSRQQLCLDMRRFYPLDPRGCLASSSSSSLLCG